MTLSQTLTNSILTSDLSAEFGTNISAIMKTLLLLLNDLINTPALQIKDIINILIKHCHFLTKKRDNNLSDLKFLRDSHIFAERDIK